MMKILVLLAVLLSLTITTARFRDENVSVMVFNRDLFLALKVLVVGVRQNCQARKQEIQCFRLQYIF